MFNDIIFAANIDDPVYRGNALLFISLIGTAMILSLVWIMRDSNKK